MNRKHIMFFVITGIIAIALFFVVMSSSQNKDCDSISDQSLKNDCYHALAHETNNKAVCDKISDSEKKEHCLGHVPE